MNLILASLLTLTVAAAPQGTAKPAQAPAAAAHPRVALETSKGRIVLELYQDKAPKTVANFLQYTKSGHYNGTIFHRVIADFMIQGGGIDTKGQMKPTQAPVKNEADNGLRNDPYTVAMARTGEPDSAKAQFFINLKDNSFLNHTAKTREGWGYTVFGKVVEGKEVVDAIAKVQVAPGSLSEAVPAQQIVITKASVLPAAK